jgi:nucleoprotein TPR
VQAGAGQLADQDARYAAEAAGLKRLVRMLEEREGAAKAVMERIERDWADVGSRTEAREAALLEEAADERARADRAEKRVRHLEDVLRRVDSGEFQAPAPGALPSLPATPAFGTPARADAFGGGMFGLSPTVALASRTQKSGKTFTEVYSDYVKLQEELARKNLEYENMEQTLKHVLGDIEERVRSSALFVGWHAYLRG